MKTSASISLVEFEKTTYKEYKKVITNDWVDRQTITAFTFASPVFSSTKPPTLIIGYKNGLIVVYSEEKIINYLNADNRGQNIFYQKPVSQILTTPNDQEIIAIFNDSSMVRYNVKTTALNELFLSKFKKFATKITFNNETKSRLKKTSKGITQGAFISDSNPEQSNFYAINHDSANSNPISYYRFNCKTIADAAVIGHPRFQRSFLKNADSKSDIILAFVSYDGYFVVFDYEKMEPQFSLKSFFGGYNAFTFSPNCEYLALAGHDDCISVLQVETLRMVRCIGHRSFISRAIFQSVPFNSEDTSEEASKETFEKCDFIRIIGAGMDSKLSVYELEKSLFRGLSNLPETKAAPIFVNANKLPEPMEVKALTMQGYDEAVGWVELCDNLMVVCTMDGAIVTYQIQNLVEKNSPTKQKDGSQPEKVK